MNSSVRSRRVRFVAGCTAVASLLAACGGSDDAEELPPAEAEAPADDGEAAEGVAVQQNGPVEFEVGTQLEPFDPSTADPSVGVTAPVVDGERFDGSAIQIGAPGDGPTLYVFLAHWCPHCNDEIPELIELNDDGRLPDDLDVVGISTAVAADRDNYPPSEWLEEKQWPWDAMADDETVTAMNVFGGTSFPFSVLVDADGTVLARRAGSAPADELAAWIDDALAGSTA